MVYQVVSLAGAIVILFAFAAQQFRRLSSETRTYQSLNLIGGFCLFVAALDARQYGFILMEGSWTAISAWGLWRLRKGANLGVGS